MSSHAHDSVILFCDTNVNFLFYFLKFFFFLYDLLIH